MNHQISVYSIAQWFVFILYQVLFILTFDFKESWLITIILLFLGVFLIILEYKRIKRFNSPLILWYLFWIIVISIGRMDLKLYEFGTTWNSQLLTCVVLCSISFFISFWIGEIGRPEESVWTKRFVFFNGDRLLRVLRILIIIAISAFIMNVVYTKSIPQFSDNVNSVRSIFVETILYKVVNGLRCIFMFVPIAIKYGKNIVLKREVLVLAIILFALEMLSGWRGYTFQAIIMVITSSFLLVDIKEKKEIKKNKKRVFLIAVFSIVFIMYIAVTRAGVSGSLSSQMKYTIQTIYLYIAPNFLNFQNAMISLTPKGYPLYTTEAVWGLFVSEQSMPGFENINQNIGAYNVSSYMLQPYADLGLFGVMAWTIIIGFLSAKSYQKCFQKPNFIWISILCILNVTIFTMHNGFFLRASSVVLWLLVGAFIHWYLKPVNDLGDKNGIFQEEHCI